HARRNDEAQDPAEQQVEEVVAGVDRSEADADRQKHRDAALARERQPARRAPPSNAHQVSTGARPTNPADRRPPSARARPIAAWRGGGGARAGERGTARRAL